MEGAGVNGIITFTLTLSYRIRLSLGILTLAATVEHRQNRASACRMSYDDPRSNYKSVPGVKINKGSGPKYYRSGGLPSQLDFWKVVNKKEAAYLLAIQRGEHPSQLRKEDPAPIPQSLEFSSVDRFDAFAPVDDMRFSGPDWEHLPPWQRTKGNPHRNCSKHVGKALSTLKAVKKDLRSFRKQLVKTNASLDLLEASFRPLTRARSAPLI